MSGHVQNPFLGVNTIWGSLAIVQDFAIPVVVCLDSGEACTYADCLGLRITDIDRIFCVYLVTVKSQQC